MKTKSQAAAASHAIQRAHARQLCHVISSRRRLRIQRRRQVVEERRGSRLVRAAQQARGERKTPRASHAAQHTHRSSRGGGRVCRRERGAHGTSVSQLLLRVRADDWKMQPTRHAPSGVCARQSAASASNSSPRMA
jgi:hypothetical protein